MHRVFPVRVFPLLCLAWLFLFSATGPLATSAQAQDLSSPRAAWATLEAAYQNRDIETVIAGRDYLSEARKTAGIFSAADLAAMTAKVPNFLQLMAQQTEDDVRKRQRDTTGYPLHCDTVCHITAETPIAPDLVELQQHCVTKQGNELAPRLYFTRQQGKWRSAYAWRK